MGGDGMTAILTRNGEGQCQVPRLGAEQGQAAKRERRKVGGGRNRSLEWPNERSNPRPSRGSRDLAASEKEGHLEELAVFNRFSCLHHAPNHGTSEHSQLST